jgi:hypothetical protein
MLDKKPTRSRELLTILAFCGFVALAAGSAQSPETEKPNATGGVDSWQEKKDRQEADIMEQRPADQKALFSLFNNGRKEIKASQNEITEARAEDAWERKWCAATKKLRNLENWTGTISELRWNGFFSVEISFYPKDDGTLKLYDLDIKEGTDMFKVISELKTEMPVKISGYFIEPEVGCFDGARLRLQEMRVHTTKVAPIGE